MSRSSIRAQKHFDDEKYFSESDDEYDSEPEEAPMNAQNTLRNVDFATLAEAQSSLDSDRRRSHHTNDASEPTSRTDADKVNSLRARLSELKSLKSGSSSTSTKDQPHDPTRSTTSSRNRASLASTSNSHARSSKHAPTEQSSKYQVTRRRTITELPSNPTHARDPRFSAGMTSASTTTPAAATALKNNYAFLADYRASELSTLKAELSSLKSAASKRKSRALLPTEEVQASRLRVAINRLENRAKAEADKERAAEVVRRHRREERAAVAEGKKPYFLKKGEVRKRALTEKFEGMKARERDRAVKRREKKRSERERRAMPGDRRGV